MIFLNMAGEFRNNIETFESLARLNSEISEYDDTDIALDCSGITWFDAHLSAPLRTIVAQAAAKGNRVRIYRLRDDIRLILSKNGLLKRKVVDTHKTTMPMRQFSLTDWEEFTTYTKRHLSRPEMPKMTPQLTLKFHEGLDEIFGNCALHSESELKVVVAGQFYPRKHLINMSISDGGIGIAGALRKAGLPMRNHASAISWAMEKNNTTRMGDIPGGLGSAVLREFIATNGGKLIVASQRGFWCQNGGHVEKQSLDGYFPGTTVILEINTSDKKAYDLSSRVKATEIW